MNKFCRFATVILCLLPLPALAQQVSVIDDVGNRVTLEQPAQRIVSLSPHLTELLFAAGAGSKLVGVVEYSDYPAAARQITNLGSALNLDLEMMLTLRPDLVVAWESGNADTLLEKIEHLGFPLYRSEPRQLEDVVSAIEALAILAGTDDSIAAVTGEYNARLQQLRQQNRDKPRLTVFYQIWHQPLMTINREHIISKVIELCGGENIFAELSGLAPQVSLEAVLRADPQVILVGDRGSEREKWLKYWGEWDDISAIKQGNIFVIHPDLIERQTPRILEGATQVCLYLDQARQRWHGSAGIAGRPHSKDGADYDGQQQ